MYIKFMRIVKRVEFRVIIYPPILCKRLLEQKLRYIDET